MVPQTSALALGGNVAPDSIQQAWMDGLAPSHAWLQWLLEGAGWALLRPLLDFALSALAVVVALLWTGGGTTAVSAAEAPILALPVLVVMLSYARGVYRGRLRLTVLDGIVPVVSVVSTSAMIVATAGLLVNGHVPGQSAWIRSWLFGLVLLALGRSCLTLLQRWARTTGRVGRPVLIMGAGMIGAQIGRRLLAHPEYGLIPVGFLDEDPRSSTEVGGRDVPVLGTVADLEVVAERIGVRSLIVAFSSVADARISRLVQHCLELGMEVSVVPRMFDTINDRVSYDTVGGLPLMSFTTVDTGGVRFAIKHGLDRLLALMLLVILSPILALAAIAVRLTSPGPAIFRQRRVGRDGKQFDLYKFRSMRAPRYPPTTDGTSGLGTDFLLAWDTAPGGVEGEDRRTAVGRVLRNTSIDELPQLINVLRGDMSLVGPRPERPEFVEMFRQDISRYVDRHRVKSGITGWAQVHGLRGQTSLAERVEWDNYYIAHWSLSLDLKILALTVVALLRNAE